jgi:hypothetical protein
VTDTALQPVRIPGPPPGWTGRAAPSPDADKKATQALVFGIVSFVVDPLLLPTIIAITYGVKALRGGTAHRGRAVAGIVLGAAGIAIAVGTLALMLPLLLVDRAAASQHALETSITTTMANAGDPVTGVHCPAVPSTAAGATVTCTADRAGAGQVRLAVAFLEGGRFTVQEAASAV